MGFAVGSSNDKQNKPVVNVTPLVDVALVVLIIFMVVAPMLTRSLSLILPPEAKANAAPQSNEPIVVTLAADKTLRVNRQPVDVASLPTLIPELLAATTNKVIHFDADDALPYGEVVTIVDACRQAGAVNIAIVTKKLPD